MLYDLRQKGQMDVEGALFEKVNCHAAAAFGYGVKYRCVLRAKSTRRIRFCNVDASTSCWRKDAWSFRQCLHPSCAKREGHRSRTNCRITPGLHNATVRPKKAPLVGHDICDIFGFSRQIPCFASALPAPFQPNHQTVRLSTNLSLHFHRCFNSWLLHHQLISFTCCSWKLWFSIKSIIIHTYNTPKNWKTVFLEKYRSWLICTGVCSTKFVQNICHFTHFALWQNYSCATLWKNVYL